MQELCSQSPEELKKNLVTLGEKPFRAKQILEWLYQKWIIDLSQMSNLSKELRKNLQSHFTYPLLTLNQTENSEDGQTEKFLFALQDQKWIESVYIKAPNRDTLCVSSQVGCPARCSFCASGKKGLKRNLVTGEIIEQVIYVQQALGKKLSNIVFMGMGEPFENYDAVIKAIRILTHPDAFGFSPRRITLSTVGMIDQIYRFAEENLPINLVLSLHAPEQKKRERIIPYARKNPLDELLAALDHYFALTKREITYEYTLIDKINDQEEDANKLASLLEKKQCTVNLIPYNPISGISFKTPPHDQIVLFRSILERQGINTTWRYTKGRDIAAACGQLALKETLKNFVNVR